MAKAPASGLWLVAVETLDLKSKHWAKKCSSNEYQHEGKKLIAFGASAITDQAQLFFRPPKRKNISTKFSNLALLKIGGLSWRVQEYTALVQQGCVRFELKSGTMWPHKSWIWGLRDLQRKSTDETEIPATKGAVRRWGWKGSYLTRCPTQQSGD